MTPLAIYQRALDVVSQAALAGYFERYADQIDLPYLIHTDTARLLVTTRDDLRPTFQTLVTGLQRRGVTHYERVAHTAEFVHRDRIEGQHNTHLIVHGESIAWPQTARHTIVRRGTSWLFSEAHYAIAADRWPVDDATMFAHAPLPASREEAE